MINFILTQAQKNNWNSYEEIFDAYAKKSNKKTFLHEKRTILGLIRRFDILNQFLDGSSSNFSNNSRYDQLSDEFKSVIVYYRDSETIKKKACETICTNSSTMTTFLLCLQEQGINKLSEITEDSILSIFVSSNGNLQRSYSFKNSIKNVLQICLQINPFINHILSFLPKHKRTRINIQFLTTNEINSLQKSLNKSDSTLSLRDKAIGTLALYTGLRSCDIAGLTLDCIDWDKDLINIIQQKTGVPLILPLTAIVGNAIYDYLINERPKMASKYVFLSNVRPFSRLTSSGLRNISIKIMDDANIRQIEGDRKGLHLFRHYVATKLLENEVPQPVISCTLGHTSPKSLDTYLNVDLKHLKSCALSIEKFPLPKGLLNHET
jgi:integrase